ncbi:hypothetical protein AeRB84_011878 [Aphanomyces euteiches]|nr:hypothetical protein AeRB84_011878 [Aphanomyces euteiches]
MARSCLVICYTRHKEANLVTLLAIFGVLFRGLSPADAVLPFRDLVIPHFRDAAYCACSFGISALDCASAVDKAVRSKLWDLTKFDVEAYERDIKLSSGDMTWIVPGRLLAFRYSFPAISVVAEYVGLCGYVCAGRTDDQRSGGAVGETAAPERYNRA